MDKFKDTLLRSEPAQDWPAPLKAMWHDGKGNWDKAHHLVQDDMDGHGAWVHAYLHRKEGDISNADYWYRRAGKPRPHESLEEEWENISQHLYLRKD